MDSSPSKAHPEENSQWTHHSLAECWQREEDTFSLDSRIWGGWHSLHILSSRTPSDLATAAASSSPPPPSYTYCASAAQRSLYYSMHWKALSHFPIHKPLQSQGQGPAQNSPYLWSFPWPPSLRGSRTSLAVSCFPPTWSLSPCLETPFSPTKLTVLRDEMLARISSLLYTVKRKKKRLNSSRGDCQWMKKQTK